MRNKISLWTISAIVALSVLSLQSDASQGAMDELGLSPSAPLVVELFTSQSCSSCPPADQVLKELANNAPVIALGCHVTYWDHLNWKDTLSRKFCTDRQRSYAAYSGNNRVYTPQMVINGTTKFVGSNRARAAEEITKITNTIAPIDIKQLFEKALSITLPQLNTKAERLTLWFFTYEGPQTQNMKSGENRGRTIAYTNPVKHLKNIGTWNGEAKTLNIPLPPLQSGGYAILAQVEGYGPIRAAGQLRLNERSINATESSLPQ